MDWFPGIQQMVVETKKKCDNCRLDDPDVRVYTIYTGSRKVGAIHLTRQSITANAVLLLRVQDGVYLFACYLDNLNYYQTKGQEYHEYLVSTHKAPPPNRLGSGAARPPAVFPYYHKHRHKTRERYCNIG